MLGSLGRGVRVLEYKNRMPANPKDARLRELQFLAKIDRTGGVLDLQTMNMPDADKSMIITMINRGYLNALDTMSWTYRDELQYMHVSRPENNDVLMGAERERWNSISRVLGGQRVSLRLGHGGRVHMSELEQALQTGRDRDPTGLMLSKRHLDRDLAIAVLSARPETPVSVAFLDMNGLKAINDRHGHGAGDEAITTYLQALATICGEGIEGYRGDGGDEVVLVLRAMPRDRAGSLLKDVLAKLAGEKVEGIGVVLTASCGIATTGDPGADGDAVKERADKAQYRAKSVARKAGAKSSVVAVEDGEPEIVGT